MLNFQVKEQPTPQVVIMAYHVNGSGPFDFTTGVYVPEIPQIPQLANNWGASGARGGDPRINPDGTYNFEEKFRRASGRREWVIEEKRLRLVKSLLSRDILTY